MKHGLGFRGLGFRVSGTIYYVTQKPIATVSGVSQMTHAKACLQQLSASTESTEAMVFLL